MISPLNPIQLTSSRELTPASLDDWARQCGDALDSGARMLTMFGRAAADDEVVTTAVFQAEGGRLGILRGRGKRGDSFDSLTPRHPAVQMFERELWEQAGLTPAGHPWLKPVRYEGARQQQMAQHPFFKVQGQDIHEVGVGPIHASVIEPGHFRFMCHGEQVHHLEIQLGYQHRGVEGLLLTRPPLALTSLIESVAGDTSVAYAWAHCAAVEALCGSQVDLATDLVRGVALELERIAMHVGCLSGMTTDIAFLQGGATYGRLRTAIINASMRACGSRFGRGWLRPGGVRRGVDDALRHDLLSTLTEFSRDIEQVNDLVCSARSVRSRLRGVGVVSALAAREIGLVGLAARASGLAVDTRCSLPGSLYGLHPVTLLTEDSGDCWARMTLRMREIDESVRWLRQVLDLPCLDLAAAASADPSPPGLFWPDTVCVSVREGFRGPVVHVLETDAQGQLIHYKLQDPSMLNWFGVALSMRNNEISDFPICNKSFDLSYCGNDL